MTADQVLNAMVNNDHTFAPMLNDYCKQEDVLGILLMKADNHANTCLIISTNGSEIMDGKKKTRQAVQIVKVEADDYMNLRRAYYSKEDWGAYYVEIATRLQREEQQRIVNAQRYAAPVPMAANPAPAGTVPQNITITYSPLSGNVTISNAF
jgi:hypothetical protein